MTGVFSWPRYLLVSNENTENFGRSRLVADVVFVVRATGAWKGLANKKVTISHDFAFNSLQQCFELMREFESDQRKQFEMLQFLIKLKSHMSFNN